MQPFYYYINIAIILSYTPSNKQIHDHLPLSFFSTDSLNSTNLCMQKYFRHVKKIHDTQQKQKPDTTQ